MHSRIEWDPAKNRAIKAQHGISLKLHPKSSMIRKP
jgi:hypothetical protein